MNRSYATALPAPAVDRPVDYPPERRPKAVRVTLWVMLALFAGARLFVGIPFAIWVADGMPLGRGGS